jgi:hypothetical protein
MSRFEVKTPEAFWTGISAGISFAQGRAVVTSDTDAGLRALYYFAQSGYGIAPLDGVEIGEVLARANEDGLAEHARLTRENEELKARLDVKKLREENERLSAEVFKTEGEQDAQAGEPATTQPPLQAPPAENAGVREWRKWAVESGRATEEEANGMDKATIMSVHGAAYDEERAARLRADAANGGEQA